MHTVRNAAGVALLVLASATTGCGGGSDSPAATDAIPDPTVSTTAPTTDDTEPDATATDIEPCALLTTEELESQATVAHVTSFKVTSQNPSPPDSRGAVRCETAFTVINDDAEGSSEISAVVNIEVLPRDADGEYDRLHEFSGEIEDVAGVGDKAFWSPVDTEMVILAGDRLVKIDVEMPGVFEETNRPVADAIAPIVVGRL